MSNSFWESIVFIFIFIPSGLILFVFPDIVNKYDQRTSPYIKSKKLDKKYTQIIGGLFIIIGVCFVMRVFYILFYDP